MKYFQLSLCIFVFAYSNYTFACTGGTSNQGSLNPTNGYQTIATMDGYFYTMNVVCGNLYNFDFCANGGSSGSLFPEISILDVTGAIQYAFSPYLGGCSTLSWTAGFTGTIRILITDSGCFQGGSYTGTMAYNYNTSGAINPAFSLSSTSCTQATATITGTTGGAFAFNPAPGDGAAINSTTGTISNGVSGSTYAVQYSVCGNSSTQSIALPTTSCWELNGNAQWITVGSESCIQLTAEVNNQTGCAWDETLIDFNSDFTLSVDYYFGNNINGADGTTFTFQPNPGACGTAGGQLGAGGIANSLVIEFDTYDNDNPTHAVDIAADHIAVEIDGDLLNSSHLCGPTAALASNASIDDGAIHSVDIQWDAATQTLSVFFDGALRITCNYDFVANVFGGDNTVYWGATAATGGLNNQQYFCPETVVFLPAELITFHTQCDGIKEFIYWSTASEDRVDYFEVEYTYDGLLFYPSATVNGAGTTTDVNHYAIENTLSVSNQKYFRLKTVDIDGSIETTDLIAGKNCSLETSNFLNEYSFQDNNLKLNLNSKNTSIKLFSAEGKELITTQTKNEQTILISGISLSQGVYFLYLTNDKNNSSKMYKIYYSKN